MLGGVQQQEGLDGAHRGLAALILAHGHQAAFEHPGRCWHRRIRFHPQRGDGQVAEVGRLGARVDEDAAALGVVAEASDHVRGQGVEHRLAWVQPDARRFVVRLGAIHAEPLAQGHVVGGERRQQGVQSARLLRRQREDAVQIPADGQAEQPGARGHELAHVAGGELQVAFAFDVAAQLRHAPGHVAAHAMDAALGLAQRGDALRRQGVHGPQRLAFASRRERLAHHLLQGDVFEQAADHVEHLVRAERVANGLQFLEQPGQHAAFAGARGDQIGDGDVPGLAVAVDAPHALFQAGRVPRDVVVGHAGAELQVDAFPGGVRGDAEAGAVGLPEVLYLFFPRAPIHAAVDVGDVAGVAQPFQATHQVVQRVAVLGEHQPLLRRPARPVFAAGGTVFQHLAQLHELGLVALVDHLPRHAEKAGQRLHFRMQVFNGHRHHRAQHLGLEVLVGLVRLAFPVVVVRAMRVEVVLAPVQTTALAGKLLQRRLARLQIRRGAFQPFDAAVEGAQQRPAGTGQPALKHAKGQLRGAAIGQRVAEGAAQIFRGGVVKHLLAGA